MIMREIKTAEKFGILDRCLSFETDILSIPDIIPDEDDNGVSFSLDGFYDGMKYVIIIPHYDIRADRPDYWEARARLLHAVLETAKEHDLYRTGDRIEDYGEHYYFVFRCGKSWSGG